MQEFEKIKKIRTTLKLTQQEMADAIGVSKQYFSKVENGHTELSKEKAMVLCHEYDISLNWLLLDIGSMFANYVEKNAETFKTNVENILDANLNLLIFSSYIEKAFSIIKNIDTAPTIIEDLPLNLFKSKLNFFLPLSLSSSSSISLALLKNIISTSKYSHYIKVNNP